MAELTGVQARFVTGTIMPTGADRLPNPQPEPLLPADICNVSVSLNIADYTKECVEESICDRYWPCVGELVAHGVQRITIAGLPIAGQLGRKRVLELQNETTRKTGIETDSQAEATIAALKYLGTVSVAIASRWPQQLNDQLKNYFEDAGIEILTITSADQWGGQAFSMSIEQGVKLAFQLGREAMRRAPTAQALLLAGGAWRSLAAVPILEEDFGIPVITNPIAPVWRLINKGIAPPVEGWGILMRG
jgi:arylmalonate decarboxylase